MNEADQAQKFSQEFPEWETPPNFYNKNHRFRTPALSATIKPKNPSPVWVAFSLSMPAQYLDFPKKKKKKRHQIINTVNQKPRNEFFGIDRELTREKYHQIEVFARCSEARDGAENGLGRHLGAGTGALGFWQGGTGMEIRRGVEEENGFFEVGGGGWDSIQSLVGCVGFISQVEGGGGILGSGYWSCIQTRFHLSASPPPP